MWHRPTVLFLHSAGGVLQWLPFFEALAVSYELPVPEHPGVGGTDDPQWIRSMPDLAVLPERLRDDTRPTRPDRLQLPGLPRQGGGNDHIPGLEQLEEQRGIYMEWVTRQEMKIEYGEGYRRLLLRIRKDSPHAAFDDRCDTAVQARITIEQVP